MLANLRQLIINADPFSHSRPPISPCRLPAHSAAGAFSRLSASSAAHNNDRACVQLSSLFLLRGLCEGGSNDPSRPLVCHLAHHPQWIIRIGALQCLKPFIYVAQRFPQRRYLRLCPREFRRMVSVIAPLAALVA